MSGRFLLDTNITIAFLEGDASVTMQSQEQQQFIKEFTENAKDHLYTIEQGLLNLQDAKDPESVNRILRAVHSVKASAEMLGITSIEKTAYRLRKYIEILRDYPIKVDQKINSLFLQCFDALDLLVKQLESPFGLTEEYSIKVISETEPAFESLKAHLAFLVNPPVPFAEIEQVFPLASAVRDIAAKYGKHAEAKIESQETLISRSLLENLRKLLPHLVNNAIAHGIEPPEVRQAVGKSPVGKITIRAFYQGNLTVICFSDDGAGIDVERVKTKAIQKGLITTSEAQTLSRGDVYELLYKPDFSTKDKRDFNSGLGYGMDIIRSELSKIGGVITTDSTPGKRTTFTIVYP